MTKKAISLVEFTALAPDLQFEILHKHGVFVGKRKLEEQTVILFQLHSFYVEVFYREYRKSVDRILTSDQIDMLQPYLDQITYREMK